MTAAGTHPKTKRRRKVALGLALVLLGGAGMAYRHFTDPERIRALVEAQLQRYVGGLVTVGRAELSLFSGATLYDVVIASPKPSSGAPLPPLFECRKIEATHNPWDAIVGRPRIEALIALSPKCTIVHRLIEHRTNLSNIVSRVASSAPSVTVQTLPIIELRDAHVRIIARDEQGDREVQDWRLTVRGRASDHDNSIYNIVWKSTELVDGQRAGGHSRLDLRSGAARSVDGGLPRMSIETVMLAVNASMDDVGAWADLIGIDGDVHVTDYNLGSSADSKTGRSATIELSNASLSLPVSEEEAALPRAQRYVQFTDVNGTATVTAERIIADFSGTFHGGTCQVRGTIPLPITSEFVRDFGFDMTLSLVGLELPQLDRKDRPSEARAIRAWPAVAAIYKQYGPSGKADIDLELFRNAKHPGPPRVRRFRITPRGASAWVERFPYRIDHLTGYVEVTGTGGTLESLRGDHDGASITINGRFGKLGPCSPVDIHVVGTGIPLDDELHAAISPAQRETWKMFEPVGTVDLDVSITRSECTPESPAIWSTTTTASFDDLSARVQAFPYPLQHLRGSIQLYRDDIIVHEIVSRTGETQLHATGSMSFDKSRAKQIQLRINGSHVPFDDALLSSLPDTISHAVAAFRPTGYFDFSTLLTQEPSANAFRHETTVTLRGGTLKHDDHPVLVTDVRGALRITPEDTLLRGLTGYIDGAFIHADGRIDHASGSFAGTLVGKDLRPTPELYAALPPRWRDELTPITIDGNIDVEVRIPAAWKSSEADRTSVTIDWNGASVTLPQLAAPIEHVRGKLIVDSTGARATGITGHFGKAELSADIAIAFDGSKRQAEINADVRGLVLDDSVRKLFPDHLQAIWDRLSPGGTIDLTVDKLSYTNPDTGTVPTWRGTGQARLRNVSVPGAVGLDRATGVVSFDGMIRDRLGGTMLSGAIDLVGLRIERRKLTQITGDWSLLRAADDTGRLAFDGIEARVYGGTATGVLHVMLESDGAHYELSSELKDVDLSPLLRPTRVGMKSLEDAPLLRGVTNAQLDVSGTLGRTRSRRGRASLEISEGRIYRVPVVFAMLQVLNLAMPNQDTFDSLSASGFIDGDDVVIRDARIAGDEMALVGQGTVTLPSLATDFYFVSVNPNRWSRIPVLTDVIDQASRELVGLSVSGTLHDPVVQARAFHDVAEELKRLFVPRKPKNSRTGGR